MSARVSSPPATVKISLDVNIPTVPNFLTISGERDAGSVRSVSEFSEDELRAVGRLWTEKLVARSVFIKSQKKPLHKS
jgi:hypothetical protein